MTSPIIPIIIAIVVIAGAVAYFYSDLIPQEAPVTVPEEVETETGEVMEESITGLEVAQQIQSFIDTRRTTDGFYRYSYACDIGFQEDCTGFQGVYETTNTWTTYSNLGLFRATEDSVYLEKARTDADAFIEWCNETTEVNGNACVWTLFQIVELYRETGDEKYRDFLLSQGELLLDIDESGEYSLVYMSEDKDDPFGDMNFTQLRSRRRSCYSRVGVAFWIAAHWAE